MTKFEETLAATHKSLNTLYEEARQEAERANNANTRLRGDDQRHREVIRQQNQTIERVCTEAEKLKAQLKLSEAKFKVGDQVHLRGDTSRVVTVESVGIGYYLDAFVGMVAEDALQLAPERPTVSSVWTPCTKGEAREYHSNGKRVRVCGIDAWLHDGHFLGPQSSSDYRFQWSALAQLCCGDANQKGLEWAEPEKP